MARLFVPLAQVLYRQREGAEALWVQWALYLLEQAGYARAHAHSNAPPRLRADTRPKCHLRPKRHAVLWPPRHTLRHKGQQGAGCRASAVSNLRLYLDWNATTPLSAGARAAMLAALDTCGNPASLHAEGRAARALVENARALVAALVGGRAENVVFVSGASEAANALLREGLVGCCGRDLQSGGPVVVGATEHAAVLAAAGEGAVIVPVNREGVIEPATLKAVLAAHSGARVALQLANNETGVILPIPALAHSVHAAGGALIVDAVQAPGRVTVDLAALGADALFLSAHKFGGPKGVGAIVFADSRIRLHQAFLRGGGQESGQRGGTPNVLGIVGMGAAAHEARLACTSAQEQAQRRDTFETQLRAHSPDVLIFGAHAPRLPNTSLFALPGLSAERALIGLDLAGIAVSSGSACSSGKLRASHVLSAMQAPDWAIPNAIRVSIGPTTTQEDLARCLLVLASGIKYANRVA